MDSILNIAAGAAAGGVLQIISEGFSFVSQISSQQHKQLMASSEEGRKILEAENAAANDAAKRGRNAGWLTSAVVLIIVIAAFLLSWVGALPWPNMPTSIVSEQEGWSILWGLISSGPELVVTEAKGWVQGPQFWPAVEAVIGFVLGIKGVKSVKGRL